MFEIRNLIEQIVKHYTSHPDQQMQEAQVHSVYRDVNAYISGLQYLRGFDHDLNRIMSNWQKKYADYKQGILSFIHTTCGINNYLLDLLLDHDNAVHKVLQFWDRQNVKSVRSVKYKKAYIKIKVEHKLNDINLSLEQKFAAIDVIMAKSATTIHAIVEQLKLIATNDPNLADAMVKELVENGLDGKLNDLELKVFEDYAIELFRRFREADARSIVVSEDSKSLMRIMLRTDNIPDKYKEIFLALQFDPSVENLDARIAAANKLNEYMRNLSLVEKRAFATFEIIWYLYKTCVLYDSVIGKRENDTFVSNAETCINLLYSCISDMFAGRIVCEDNLNLCLNIINLLRDDPQAIFCKIYTEWVWSTLNFIFYGNIYVFQFPLLNDCMHEQIIANTDFKLSNLYVRNTCSSNDPMIILAIVFIQISCKMLEDNEIEPYSKILNVCLPPHGKQERLAVLVDYLRRTEFFIAKALNYKLHIPDFGKEEVVEGEAAGMHPEAVAMVESESIPRSPARKKLAS